MNKEEIKNLEEAPWVDLFGDDMAVRDTPLEGGTETFQNWGQNLSIEEACWVAEKLARMCG